MKIRHLKKRPRPVERAWIYGGRFTVPKETVDAITAWLKSFVRM